MQAVRNRNGPPLSLGGQLHRPEKSQTVHFVQRLCFLGMPDILFGCNIVGRDVYHRCAVLVVILNGVQSGNRSRVCVCCFFRPVHSDDVRWPDETYLPKHQHHWPEIEFDQCRWYYKQDLAKVQKQFLCSAQWGHGERRLFISVMAFSNKLLTDNVYWRWVKPRVLIYFINNGFFANQ